MSKNVCLHGTVLSLQQFAKKKSPLEAVPVAKTEKISSPDMNQAASFCQGAQKMPVRRFREGTLLETNDWIADEVPVALEFNGISHAVMLATPLNLEEFALGFALSEGIVNSRSEFYAVDEEPSYLGITLKVLVASSSFERLKHRRRSLAGRTGCGLCGTESLNHVARDLPVMPCTANTTIISCPAVARGMSGIFSLQALQQATGAVHAAAWCSPQGEVMCLREDVGRHNALDKLIGALALQSVDASAGFVAVTSRASFEMVQKTASAGVPLLAAVSAPTSLAISTAQRLGLTLVGFVRQQNMVVYSHDARLDTAALPCRLGPNEF